MILLALVTKILKGLMKLIFWKPPPHYSPSPWNGEGDKGGEVEKVPAPGWIVLRILRIIIHPNAVGWRRPIRDNIPRGAEENRPDGHSSLDFSTRPIGRPIFYWSFNFYLGAQSRGRVILFWAWYFPFLSLYEVWHISSASRKIICAIPSLA